MRSISIVLAACVLTTPAAALERRQNLHVVPPVTAHPLPQGAPYAVSGDPSHAPVELRYGEIDGKRVLFEPTTGRVVYRLNP